MEEQYENIATSVSISPKNFQPASAEQFVTIRLDSSCGDKLRPAENEVICEKVVIDQKFDFTALIELQPEICDNVNTKDKITFDLRVFGQSNSTLTVEIGRCCFNLVESCNTCFPQPLCANATAAAAADTPSIAASAQTTMTSRRRMCAERVTVSKSKVKMRIVESHVSNT